MSGHNRWSRTPPTTNTAAAHNDPQNTAGQRSRTQVALILTFFHFATDFCNFPANCFYLCKNFWRQPNCGLKTFHTRTTTRKRGRGADEEMAKTKLDHDGLLTASMASTAVPALDLKNADTKFQETQKYTNFASLGRKRWKYFLL